MLRRLLKPWELWTLAILIWLATMIIVRERWFQNANWRSSVYFDGYDWGIDYRGGFFCAAWGAFGYPHSREVPSWGFAILRGDNWPESGNGWYWYIRIPFWAPALLFIPAAVRNARRLVVWFRYLPRFPEGCCQKCGYDLRATPDRCPECGTLSDNS